MTRERVIKGAMLVLAMLVGAGCGSGGGSDSQDASHSLAPASLFYTTDTALMRVNTDGTGVMTLDDAHTGIWSVTVTGDTLVYMIDTDDLWAVQVDGTNRRELVRGTYLRDVIGPWVLYDVREALASVRLDGTGARLIFEPREVGGSLQFPNYAAQVAGRAVIEFRGNYVSLLPDGTDSRQLTFYPPFPILNNEPFTSVLPIRHAIGATAIYTTVESSPVLPDDTPKLFAVSVLGGPVVKLGEGPDQETPMAVVGTRVVYARCVVRPSSDGAVIDQCNVMSVLSTGQDRIALTNTADINWVQGVIGQQIIIRRGQRGTNIETLVEIPVTGGSETLILTLGRNEFVRAIVGNRIVLQRDTGLWSVLADGRDLVQLSESANRFSFVGVSNALGCFLRGSQLWCVPVDGSAAAIQVADKAKAIIGL